MEKEKRMRCPSILLLCLEVRFMASSLKCEAQERGRDWNLSLFGSWASNVFWGEKDGVGEEKRRDYLSWHSVSVSPKVQLTFLPLSPLRSPKSFQQPPRLRPASVGCCVFQRCSSNPLGPGGGLWGGSPLFCMGSKCCKLRKQTFHSAQQTICHFWLPPGLGDDFIP
jgi:hypothetical protein